MRFGPVKVATMLLHIYLLCMMAFVYGDIDCKNVGFNKDTLQCTTCETLNKVVGDSDFYQECKSCCIVPTEEIYEKAVLEIDKRILTYAGDIKKVMKSVKKEDKVDFEVRYKFGSRPTLLMYKKRSDESPSESVSVGSWEESLLSDYLKVHLKEKAKV
jgi:hypothetical protein